VELRELVPQVYPPPISHFSDSFTKILIIVACHFAELGANVTIAGRSVKDAEFVLDKLRAAAPSKDAEFDFVQFDASLKSNTIEFADKMREKYEKTGLYALVMTHGAAANGDPRKETSEGHELCAILL
jgi:NAD(P)-dependent dehydrogenase (short-subunit alcohol dehydrogenase family)